MVLFLLESLSGLALTIGTYLQVTVHKKLHFQITNRAQMVNQQVRRCHAIYVGTLVSLFAMRLQMDNQLISRAHALKTLRINFRFLSVDECDMLLDLFGSCSVRCICSCSFCSFMCRCYLCRNHQ